MIRNSIKLLLIFGFGILFLLACKNELSDASICACAEGYSMGQRSSQETRECEALFARKFGTDAEEAKRWLIEHCEIDEIYFEDHIMVMKKDQENAIEEESIAKLAVDERE